MHNGFVNLNTSLKNFRNFLFSHREHMGVISQHDVCTTQKLVHMHVYFPQNYAKIHVVGSSTISIQLSPSLSFSVPDYRTPFFLHYPTNKQTNNVFSAVYSCSWPTMPLSLSTTSLDRRRARWPAMPNNSSLLNSSSQRWFSW